jgi:transcriptional regulator NrdR family protein
MHCPRCSGTELRVLQTRRNPVDPNGPLIRQRVCRACGHRWFTAEVSIPSFTVTQGVCGYFRTTADIVVHPAVA